MTQDSLASSQGGAVQHDVESPLHLFHREVNRLFDDIFLHGRAHAALQHRARQAGPLMPSIDVSETDGEIRIRAELPGVANEDIDVSIDNDILVIRGEKKFEKKDATENFHIVERSYGTFQRALRLPHRVATDKVSADFNDGVLTITLPKSEKQATSRKIPVGRSGAQTTKSGS